MPEINFQIATVSAASGHQFDRAVKFSLTERGTPDLELKNKQLEAIRAPSPFHFLYSFGKIYLRCSTLGLKCDEFDPQIQKSS